MSVVSEQHLSGDEALLMQQVANTSRAYRDSIPAWWAATITIELALRLAEKSYRRGFQQGAESMRDITGDTPDERGQQHAEAIAQWRARGAAEGYTRGDFPPGR